MFAIWPVVKAVFIFGAASWGVNKALKAVTGKDIEENLDDASNKVIDFVKAKQDSEKAP